jgi:hypothetical protein
LDELGGRFGCLLHIRTGQVQLDGHDCVAPIEKTADTSEVIGTEPADGHPDRNRDRLETRQLIPKKRLDARVLEADRVQHSVLRLGEARRRVPRVGAV